MAARYWVGGNAAWDATAGTKWATTSGGAGGASVPTAADDVYLDNGAGTGNITGTTSAVCRSLDCTGYVGTLTISAGQVITVGTTTAGAGNIAIKLVAGMTLTLGNSASGFNFISTSGTQQTVTTGGKNVGAVQFSGAGSSYLFSDSFTAATITHTAGTLDTGNQTVVGTTWNYGNATARTMTLGSSAITLSTNFTGTSTSNLTITANTAVITLTNANPALNLTTNAKDWNGLSFVLTGTTTATLTSATTGNTIINDLTLSPGAVKTFLLSLVGNLTINTLTINSNSDANNIMVASSVRGTARTLTVASLVCTNRVDWMDITAAGAATWTVAASGASYFGDAGGNSGITMTTPAAQTISSGSWDNAANWTSRIPIPQEDVTLTGSSAITLNMFRFGKNIDMSGYSGTLTLTSSGTNYDFFGSMTLGSGMSWGANPNTFNINASGRSSYTITSNGKAFFPAGSNSNFTIACPGGTYTLTDALSQRTPVSASFTILAGSFDSANYNCELGRITGTGTITRSATWGSSSVSLYLTSAAGAITLAATGLTWSGASATFTIVNTSANTRTVELAGASIGTFDYSIAGSTGQLSMGSGRISTLKFSDASNVRTLSFTSTSTMIIDDWSQVFGRSGALITINSSSAGTRRTIGSFSASQQTLNYISLIDVQFISPNKFFVTNGTDAGNNRNVVFGSATGGIFQKQSDSAVSGAPVTTLSDTFPIATTLGKLLILTLGWSANPGAVTLSGWSLAKAWNRTISGTGAPYGAIYYKIADGTETAIAPTWVNSAVPTMHIQEVIGFTGTPTLDTVQDNNDSATGTSLSTSNGGAGVTPTAVPAYAVAAVAGNGGMGATTTAATNDFGDSYDANVQSSGTIMHLATLYMSASAAKSTTMSWTTSRVPAAGLVFFYDVAGNNYTQDLNDSVTPVDTDVVSFGKILSDTASPTDLALNAVGKLFNETATATDAQVKAVAQYLVDTATSTDQINNVIGYIRDLADSVNVSDVVSTNLYELVEQIISATLQSDDRSATVSSDNLGVILESDDSSNVIENEVI